MATHHSKTGRAKSSNDKIVVPSWNSVWESFKEDNTKTTIEAMEAEGWKTVRDVARMTNLSRQRVLELANSDKMESVKKKVIQTGKTREMVFVRPKVN
jgi:hypothetical protein